MRETLISIQCSGESLEKAIALYYFTKKTNYEFYNKYNVKVFYGHNLPKCNEESCSHGTVGFYEKYYSNHYAFPNCTKEYFLGNKITIINNLVNKGYITQRAAKNINTDSKYWNFIKKLPFEYIYPEFIHNLVEKTQKILNFNLVSIDFESEYSNVINDISIFKWKYCIYALNYDGRVGRYYLKYRDNHSYKHFLYNLKHNSVLSGNSTTFIKSIKRKINKNEIIGYRIPRRFNRPNQLYGLSLLLKEFNNIEEPKNILINEKFNDLDSENISLDEKSNIVYADAFLQFIEENYEKIKNS